MKNTRKQKGFSLIELLIVVAIILIIAAIAIPNLLRARISANEASAASSIRTINTGEVSFISTYPTQGYSTPNAAGLKALGPGAVTGCPAGGPLVTAACLIDWNLSNASTVALQKSGYYFNIGNVSGGPPYSDYTAGAAACSFQYDWRELLLLERRRRHPQERPSCAGCPNGSACDLHQRGMATATVV